MNLEDKLKILKNKEEQCRILSEYYTLKSQVYWQKAGIAKNIIQNLWYSFRAAGCLRKSWEYDAKASDYMFECLDLRREIEYDIELKAKTLGYDIKLEKINN